MPVARREWTAREAMLSCISFVFEGNDLELFVVVFVTYVVKCVAKVL